MSLVKHQIKVGVNLLILLGLLYVQVGFQSDVNMLLLWTIIVGQLACLVFIGLKSKRFISSILRFQMIPICCFIGLFSVHNVNANQFEKSVNQYAADNKETTLKIAEITPFKWDRMYTFMPYMANEEIDRTIGQKWTNSYSMGAPMSEGQTLVIFMYQGKVNHYFYIHRYIETCMTGCSKTIELVL